MEASPAFEHDPIDALHADIAFSVQLGNRGLFDEIIYGQTIMSAIDVAEHLNEQREQAESPEDTGRWSACLDHYLQSLNGHEVDSYDAFRLQTVLESWANDRIR